MDLQLRHLRSFIAVAEELHFGRAASRLQISQPVVSRHIRALEAALGTALFVRTARSTTLTDAGREVLADARETLAAAERIGSRASASANGVHGSVSVGFVWTTIDPYLAALVDEMAAHNPEINLSVTHLRWVEVLPSLRRGSVDLVIARPLCEEHEMLETVIYTEPYVLAVPKSHRFAARDSVELGELAGEPMVSLDRSLAPSPYDAAMAALRERGITPEIAIHVRSPQAALALVGAGFGIYRIPESAAEDRDNVAYTRLGEMYSRVVLLTRPAPTAPALQATLAVVARLRPRVGRGVVPRRPPAALN